MNKFARLKLSDAKRTVWVFGAGASIPYEVPSQADLLNHFSKMRIPGNATVQANLEKLRTDVRKHCQKILPCVALEDSSLSLEEVFAAYELMRDDARSTREEAAYAAHAFNDLRDSLRYATYVFGRGDAKKWKPHARAGEASPYAELLEQIFPDPAKIAPGAPKLSHVLITFNYDICLDRCVINLRGTPPDLDLDYGILLSNQRCSKAPEFQLPRPDKIVLLLRTHGALNWIRCRACTALFTTVNRHADVAEEDRCWACNKTRLEHILVHPSHQRSYSDPILQQVWGRCYEELRRADRWVFIGYSLPPVDFHFRQLLREALKPETKVVLVTRGPIKNDTPAVQTYEALFPSNLSVWDATDKGFPDFVNALDA